VSCALFVLNRPVPGFRPVVAGTGQIAPLMDSNHLDLGIRDLCHDAQAIRERKHRSPDFGTTWGADDDQGFPRRVCSPPAQASRILVGRLPRAAGL